MKYLHIKDSQLYSSLEHQLNADWIKVKKGKTIPHKEIKKRYEKWFK